MTGPTKWQNSLLIRLMYTRTMSGVKGKDEVSSLQVYEPINRESSINRGCADRKLQCSWACAVDGPRCGLGAPSAPQGCALLGMPSAIVSRRQLSVSSLAELHARQRARSGAPRRPFRPDHRRGDHHARRVEPRAAWKDGFAHFFEHMSFNDSENVPVGANRKLISELEGTRNGGTSADMTI